MANDLLDRVDFCVVKANCPGPSLIAHGGTQAMISHSDPRHASDKWVCRACGGFVTLKRGEQPTKDKRKAGQ